MRECDHSIETEQTQKWSRGSASTNPRRKVMVEARVNKYFPVSVVLPIHLVLPIPEVRNSAAAEESCSSSLPSYSEDLEEQKRLMFLLASLLRPTARSGRALPGTPFYWSASRSGQIR